MAKMRIRIYYTDINLHFLVFQFLKKKINEEEKVSEREKNQLQTFDDLKQSLKHYS